MDTTSAPLSTDKLQSLLFQVNEICNANDATLLFLTLFGSRLYGTQTLGKSDIDIRGIFLPSMPSLALNTAPQSLHFSTCDDVRRNTAHDIDIDLWSLQHWLLKLLPSGDTGALDLLFSPSHTECTLYMTSRILPIFAEPLRLFDEMSQRACIEYAMSQAKKYGIKGSRLGALKCVYNWLEKYKTTFSAHLRLRDILDSLIDSCQNDFFCIKVNIKDEEALNLCGKTHAVSIPVSEFARRINSDMQRYGARMIEADKNQGVDFKALSHALRAIDQMEELLHTGKIIFPLATKDILIAVKQGAFSWSEIEPMIVDRISDFKELQNTMPFPGTRDTCFAQKQILACYNLI